jgi:Fic family protein
MFKPKYRITTEMIKMLTAIAEAKAVIGRARLLPKQEIRLRRQALLRMTHSSTAIEGNILNLRQVEALAARRKVDAPSRDIYEVENYLKAVRFIAELVKTEKPITVKNILKIHALVTAKTLEPKLSGRFRPGPVYVVRRFMDGRQETVYAAPEAKQVPQLMAELAAWINESEKQEIHPIIAAGLAHLEIAAIHPFADGNGRTARALATLILYQRGYDFRRLFALEDFYNADRPAYYSAINIGKSYESRRLDSTKWLEYFIRGFQAEIEAVRRTVTNLSAKKIDANIESRVYLDKDQITILDFLENIGEIRVNDVKDILNCPKRTAQLHLQKLKKLKMIKPVGQGRATKYILT